jgi:hypothetical protein
LAGTFKCGHCGKDHDEGTKFCPDTGKALGPASAAKKTMLMFQQPGAKLPGSSAPIPGAPPAAGASPPAPHGPPTGTPGASRPQYGSAAAPTMIGQAAVLVPQSGTGGGTGASGSAPRAVPHTPSGGVPVRTTPSGGVPARSTPSGGVPVTGSSRPSRPIQIPIPSASPKEVPPPPVRPDGVPPPVLTPSQGVPIKEASGAYSGPRQAKSSPDWVVAPQAGSGGHIPSVVLPAVDAPPKAVMDLLKDAFALYKQHVKVFLLTAALLFVPGAIVSSGLLAAIRAPLMVGAASAEATAAEIQQKLGPDFADRLARGQVTPEEMQRLEREMAASGAAAGMMMGGLMVALLGMLGWAVVAFVLYGLIVPLTSAALTIAVADRMLGGERGFMDYWKLLLARLGKLLSAQIPAALLIFVGMFFLFIPGLVLAFFFSLVPTVVLVENVGGVAALKRSFQLVKSDWLRVLLVFIVFGVINFVAHIVGGLLIPDRFLFFDTLMGDLVSLVLLPVPVLAAVLLYLDIRRKKENVDREALQAELDVVRTPA